jgi:hypothetical protein
VYNISWTADDVNLTASVPTTGAIQWQGNTLLPEEAGLPLRQIAVVFDDVIAGTNASGKLAFPTPGQNVTLRAVFHSDLDTATPASTAQANWKAYSAISSADLLASHIAAMDVRAQLQTNIWVSCIKIIFCAFLQDIWSSRIELQGNASFAATVTASLYDILISLRSDWPWSTGPGGLMTNGYHGHTLYVS